MDVKTGSILLLHPKNTTQHQSRHYLRVKGWKKVFEADGPKKQAGVAILVSEKNRLQTKTNQKRREGHHILIKGKNPARGH